MSNNNSAQDAAFEEDVREPGLLYLNLDVWGGIAVGLFGLIGWFGAGEGAFNIWVFPKTNAAVLLVAAVALIAKGLIKPAVEPVINKANGKALVAPMAGGLVLFFFLFTRLGWVLTAGLILGLAIFALQPKKTFGGAAMSFGISFGLALFFFYVFGDVFYVPWPEGTWLEPLLGG